ncbi:dentin sialophosphoprotein-like isoform X1 [Biomphalaria pfeifferi]|uniref:Dentin sialophosphoprotein-like isoform X1 n=1 Tax=Biomphalaria pfeifferi TaxID=112525 RepID=A0AAD8BKD3_BIOPF|nr:dentin sialophosphoprotein-like isoform X1 [Biomphalaria pfeifferi]
MVVSKGDFQELLENQVKVAFQLNICILQALPYTFFLTLPFVIQEFLVGQVIVGNIMSSEALNEQKLSTEATCLSSELSADPNESEGNNDKSNGNLNCNHPNKYSCQEEKGSLNLKENSCGETIPDTPESDNLNVALGESKNTFSCEHSKEDLIQSLNDNDNSNIQDVDDIDNSNSAVKNIAEGLQINTFQSDSSVFPLDQNCEDVDMEDVEKKEPLSSKTNQRYEESINKKDSLEKQQHKIISKTIDDVTSSEDIQDTNLLSKLNQPDVEEVEDIEMKDMSAESVGICNTDYNFESTTTHSSEDLNKDVIENSESSNKHDHTLQDQNINKTTETKIDNDNFIESQPDQPPIQSLEEKDFPDSTALTEGVTEDNTKTESEDSREDQSNLPNSQHPESRQPLDFTPNSDCLEKDQIKAEVSQTSQQFSLPSEDKVSPDSSQGSKLSELEAEKSDSKDSREDQTDLQFLQSSQRRDTPDSTEKETGEKAEGAIKDSQTLEGSICPDSTQDLENTDKKESEEMGACASKNKDNASDDGPRKKSASKRKENRNKKYRYGDKDTERYRAGYPGLKDNINWKDNYKFYMGEIESQPNGDYIDKIHKYWEKDYNRLEQHHGYIQWIFPIREEGMNSLAQPLQLQEIEAIQKNLEAKARILKSYKMMLGFYGMKLVDEERGTIQRAKNYRERFENLTYHTHNYLRITRILKSLGELGYEHLKKPFLEFVLHEALVEKTLAPTLSSCENYWIGTIKNDADREELYTLIDESRQAKKGRDAVT